MKTQWMPGYLKNVSRLRIQDKVAEPSVTKSIQDSPNSLFKFLFKFLLLFIVCLPERFLLFIMEKFKVLDTIGINGTSCFQKVYTCLNCLGNLIGSRIKFGEFDHICITKHQFNIPD